MNTNLCWRLATLALSFEIKMTSPPSHTHNGNENQCGWHGQTNEKACFFFNGVMSFTAFVIPCVSASCMVATNSRVIKVVLWSSMSNDGWEEVQVKKWWCKARHLSTVREQKFSKVLELNYKWKHWFWSGALRRIVTGVGKAWRHRDASNGNAHELN